MRKFMIAVVAVGATVFTVPAAHAVPGCSAAYEQYRADTERGSGKSTCSEGIQRVKVFCHDLITGVAYDVYGPLRGPGGVSFAECNKYSQALGATWVYG